MRNGLGAEDCYVMLPLILGGGVEPIAVALRGLMLNIINAPAVYRKLKEEIRLAIERGIISRPVQLAEAEALPYLQVRRAHKDTLNHINKSCPNNLVIPGCGTGEYPPESWDPRLDGQNGSQGRRCDQWAPHSRRYRRPP